MACRLRIGYPVAPASATRAYAALAERGARASRAMRRRGGRCGTAQSPGGSTAARSPGAVVVAAGPWTPSLVDRIGRWRPVVWSWGVVAGLALERPPGTPSRRSTSRSSPRRRTGRRTPSGRARSAVGFSLVTAGGESALGSTFLPERPERRRPATPPPPRSPRRACGRGCAARRRPVLCPAGHPDGRPLIGQLPGIEGAFLAAGHGPWGISTGPGSARLFADIVLGRSTGASPALAASRFGSVGQRDPVPG